MNLEIIIIHSISRKPGVLPPCILGRPDCCTTTNSDSAMFFSAKSYQEWSFYVLLCELDEYWSFQLQVQGVLCLRGFLRLWKNNCVSRKPCKQRNDLELSGQMRVPK